MTTIIFNKSFQLLIIAIVQDYMHFVYVSVSGFTVLFYKLFPLFPTGCMMEYMYKYYYFAQKCTVIIEVLVTCIAYTLFHNLPLIHLLRASNREY